MRVVVVGAGIAGLALAGSLQRGGHEVTALEEAGELRTGGAAIAIWHNGAAALQRLGADIAAQGRVIELLEIWTSKGRVVGRVDAARLSRQHGVEAVTIPRGLLLEVLAAQVRPGTIAFAAPCQRVRQAEGSATVELVGGGAIEADLVVGADGYRSAVRGTLTPGPQGGATGWCSLQGLTASPLALTEGRTSIYATGPGGAVGLMPAGNGLLQWWFDVRWPPSGPPTSTVEWLRQRFARWGSPVRDLLEHIREADIEPFPHVWLPVPRQLHAGRVVLIGDAVHAMPPVLAQGANQSIEDAWVLARELGRAASVPEALAGYGNERRRKVARVSRLARAPMIPLYSVASYTPGHRAVIPERFCTAAWDTVLRSSSSTVPRFRKSR